MKVSIVIPTFDGEATLRECLDGVLSQETNLPFEVLVIDSSSKDRTPEIARRFPVRFLSIDQRDFDHGDTRNLGALLTDGDLIAFLVQDAYPASRHWLRNLAAAFDDLSVAGAYSRILPRPTASPLVRRGVESDVCFRETREHRRIDDLATWRVLDPHSRRRFIDFNDVSSCLRRSVWRQLPFARIPFGEDLVWARGALEAGHAIVYEPSAEVVHSHEYDSAKVKERARVDGWWNRAYLDRINVASRSDALALTLRAFREDRQYLRRPGVSPWRQLALSTRSLVYHFKEYEGFRQGGQTVERRPTPRAVPEESLRVLLVAHGFPPETLAGTEVFTRSLGRALQARGHEVSVLHRVADPSAPDFSLSEGRQDGLRVVRLVNHLRDAHIGESYDRPRVDEIFRELLRRERPQVVHFQHLIHLSARLPRIASEEGVPSLVTLNDYWFRCPKVQLLRHGGRVCEGPPPGLGCAACVGERPELVPPLRALSRLLRLPLRLWAEARVSAGRHAGRRGLTAHLLRRSEVMREGLGAAELLIAPSRFLAEKAVEAGFPREKLVVSDYGMEGAWLEDFERRERVLDRRVRFGFVGSLVPYKGLSVLARAFASLGHSTAELHIHGDFESLDLFRQTAAEVRDLAPKAIWHGPFEAKDLARVLGSLDVLVVPSTWYENSPLTIHEAFQARVPVLVSDLGGMRELVQEGRGGLRFRAADPKDLARVMKRFLDFPGLGSRLARDAPAVKRIETCAAEMEVKYRQAIGLRSGRDWVG